MKKITEDQLVSFIRENEILFGNQDYPGIVLTPDNRIGKFFYKRKRLSTSTFFPQALRFCKNSEKLSDLNIVAPRVSETLYCPDSSRYVVIYDHISGTDYRELCHRGETQRLSDLPEFISLLHQKGIYFRAIHLGNLIRCLDEKIALIDISDLAIKKPGLTLSLRMRNLIHLIDTKEDKGFFSNYGLDTFFEEYLLVSGLTPKHQSKLRRRFDAFASTLGS